MLNDNVIKPLERQLQEATEKFDILKSEILDIRNKICEWSNIGLIKKAFQISETDEINKIINNFTIEYITKDGKKMIAMQFLFDDKVKHFNPTIFE